MRTAVIVAVCADVLQWCFGPLGWMGVDQVIDIAAMIVCMSLLGFHVLLLPTAVLEFLPIIDLLPTWTGCVLLVIAQRKKQKQPPKPAIIHPPPLITEVSTTGGPDQAPASGATRAPGE